MSKRKADGKKPGKPPDGELDPARAGRFVTSTEDAKHLIVTKPPDIKAIKKKYK